MEPKTHQNIESFKQILDDRHSHASLFCSLRTGTKEIEYEGEENDNGSEMALAIGKPTPVESVIVAGEETGNQESLNTSPNTLRTQQQTFSYELRNTLNRSQSAKSPTNTVLTTPAATENNALLATIYGYKNTTKTSALRKSISPPQTSSEDEHTSKKDDPVVSSRAAPVRSAKNFQNTISKNAINIDCWNSVCEAGIQGTLYFASA